jgi:hypothetical protein
MRRHSRARIKANLVTFTFIGGFGIVLWCLWCEVIFRDPLYFQHSPFSSQAQQQSLIRQHYLFTYHNLEQSIRTYALDSALNVGAMLLAFAAFALVIFFLRRGITPETIAIIAFLIPFAFYVFSLYTGQAALFVPGASPAHAPRSMLFYNTRYGIQMLAPAAILSATLVSWRFLRKGQLILQAGLGVIVILQSVLTVHGGIVSLQSGQSGALPRIWCCFLACDVVKTRIFSICNIQRKTYFLMNILENGRYSCLPPLFAMWERSCEASLSSF